MALLPLPSAHPYATDAFVYTALFTLGVSTPYLIYWMLASIHLAIENIDTDV